MAAAPVRVDRTNQTQSAAWDGSEGALWASNADRFDLTLERYQQPLLRAADVEPNSRVLDIGCGTGRTARDVARLAPHGHVLGVDLSARMLDVARTKADLEGLRNVQFLQADAQVHPFPAAEYDIAVSRAGVMFFGEPPAAFANIGRALRPGGRLVLLTWQPPDRNAWVGALIRALTGGEPPVPPVGAPGPFSLSDPVLIRELLAATGFEGIRIDGVAEPMCFGRDVDDANSFVLDLLGWMLQDRDDAERRRATDALRATLQAHSTPDGVLFGSAGWLISAQRSGRGVR